MSAIRFRQLTIRRMPGIEQPFELTELGSGINLVYGPNGSGKTTVARALTALVWPEGGYDGWWIGGRFDLGGASWHVEVEARTVRVFRDGEPAGHPNRLPVEASTRYRLELRELLAAQDVELARAVALEAAGGYDVERAARLLSPRRVPQRPVTALRELRAARERLLRARDVQEQLQMELEWLRTSEESLAGRPALESRRQLLQIAIEHAQRSAEADEFRDRLARFHPVVGRLSGDEAERCAELRKWLAEGRERVRAAEAGRERTREAITGVGLPAAVLGSDLLPTLETHLREIDRIEAEVRAEERALASARANAERESGALEGRLASPPSSISLTQVNALAAAARELEEARVRRVQLEEECRLLTESAAGEERSRVDRGAQLLQDWLSAPVPPGARDGRSGVLAIAAAVLLIAGGAVLATLHPGALLLSAAGIGILLIALVGRRQLADPRAGYKEEFTRLGLSHAPAAWSSPAVRECLSRLFELQASARRAEEAQSRLARLGPALQSAREEEGELEHRLTEAAGELGLPDAEVGALGWMLERLARWHRAVEDADSASARLRQASTQLREELDAANELLERAGCDRARDAAALGGVVGLLSERVRDHERLSAELARFEEAAALAEARRDETADALRALFARLEIDDADSVRLGEWCGEREEFIATRRHLDAVSIEVGRLEERLHSSPSFDPALLQTSCFELQQELTTLSAELEEMDRLHGEVREFRGRMHELTRGHAVEDAIADVARCEATLRDLREREVRSAIAAVLVDYVEAASRLEQRPAVLNRAASLLTRITHGRYDLRFADGDAPEFRAYDTEAERSMALDQLSSATRLQLLLAVRLAFAELHEGGTRLPLLLDEALANSDDERTRAIIETVATLAAEGRQVFYFTAQPDEVGKWRHALEAANIPCRLIDLAEARRLGSQLDDAELDRRSAPQPVYPAPGGKSHGEYGRLLQVPRANPREPIGSLHLWYLVEDPKDLYRIMVGSGSDRFGSFRAFVDAVGDLGLGHGFIRRLDVLAAAAETALANSLIGKGRPVDRHALMESGAVSDRFLDEVTELAESMEGSALHLVEALADRVVPHFQQRSVAALAEYLEEAGYLDRRGSLGAVAIRTEVFRQIRPALEAGVVQIHQIDRLLTRLGIDREVQPRSRRRSAEEPELWTSMELFG